MEALFACLLLSPQLCFRDFSTTKIGWSTKDFELPGRGLENDQAFEATMRQYRLVVYNRTIVQCSMNMYDKENEETVLRRRISDAYDGSFHHAEPDLYLSD